MCTTVGFDANGDSVNFSHGFNAEFYQKIGLPQTCRLVLRTKIKSKLGYVTPTGLPGEGVDSFLGNARL